MALLGSVAISAPSRSASGRLPSLLGLAKALRRGLAATKAEKKRVSFKLDNTYNTYTIVYRVLCISS